MSKQKLWTILLVGAITALSIHVVGLGTEGARLDFTSDALYSLSPGTEAILDRMHAEGVEPIDITLYFSETSGKTLPRFIKDFIGYQRYLRSLLKEYERAAEGKISIAFVDPVTDSDDAQRAADDGLDGKPINQNGDLFYFGMVFETRTGSRDRIEFLWPDQQESVEYEITRRIHSLLWPTKQKIGVLSSLEVMGSSDNPYLAQMLAAQGKQPKQQWIAMRLLRESYEVSQIPLDVDEISHDDYDLVVVVHPRQLSGKTLWAIDQWVVTGGNALVLLDPYSIDDRPPQNPREPWAALQYDPSSNLDPLLGAWGLSRPEGRFAADLELAVRRPTGQRGPAESVVVDLALDLAAKDGKLDLPSSPMLQGLGQLRFFLSGVLEKTAVEGGPTITPLLTTTSAGSTLEIQPGFGGAEGLFFTDLNNAPKLRDRLSPGSEPQILAALVTGQLPTAYPEGTSFPSKVAEMPPGWPPGVPPPTPEDAETISKDPVPEAERKESSVIVFADVDFISDQVAFQQNLLGIVLATNDNSKLFLNAVDYLLGSQELMEVRSRPRLRRPFDLFDEIEAAAEKETLEREKALRAQIDGFQEELNKKQNETTQRNAALFQRKVQEEVDRINADIRAANQELRKIRQSRREALEGEERQVRVAVMGWMPIAVLLAGVALAVRRRRQS